MRTYTIEVTYTVAVKAESEEDAVITALELATDDDTPRVEVIAVI